MRMIIIIFFQTKSRSFGRTFIGWKERNDHSRIPHWPASSVQQGNLLYAYSPGCQEYQALKKEESQKGLVNTED